MIVDWYPYKMALVLVLLSSSSISRQHIQNRIDHASIDRYFFEFITYNISVTSKLKSSHDNPLKNSALKRVFKKSINDHKQINKK